MMKGGNVFNMMVM